MAASGAKRGICGTVIAAGHRTAPNETKMTEIRFYSTRGDYGCFSNFSRHSVKLKGETWPTSEHYFQAQKFAGTPYETKVRKAQGPKEAARIGRDKANPLRRDWESVKENVMYDVLKAKFTQHHDLKAILLSTGDATLVEDSPVDWYWGCGANGRGKNRLGVLLMRLRDELKKGS